MGVCKSSHTGNWLRLINDKCWNTGCHLGFRSPLQNVQPIDLLGSDENNQRANITRKSGGKQEVGSNFHHFLHTWNSTHCAHYLQKTSEWVYEYMFTTCFWQISAERAIMNLVRRDCLTQRLFRRDVPWGTAAEVDKQNLCWKEWQGTGKETCAEGQLRRIKSEWKRWENTTRTKGWEEVGTFWVKEKTPGPHSWTQIILYKAYVVAGRTSVKRRSGPCWVTKENGCFQFTILNRRGDNHVFLQDVPYSLCQPPRPWEKQGATHE